MFSIYENPEALFSACARSCLVTVRSQRISQQKPPSEQARSSQGSRAGTERAPSHRPSAACPGPAEVLGQGRLKGRGLPQQRPTTCPARACDRQLSSMGAREPHTPEPGSSSVTVSVGTGGAAVPAARPPAQLGGTAAGSEAPPGQAAGRQAPPLNGNETKPPNTELLLR